MTAPKLLQAETTNKILSSFFEVYRVLGYGFLESVYSRSLELELHARGLSVEREVPIEVFYKGRVVGRFRGDLVVERAVVVELKATPKLLSSDSHQLLNCLRGTRLEVGLLLHFGLRATFRRMVAENVRLNDRSAAFRVASVASASRPSASPLSPDSAAEP